MKIKAILCCVIHATLCSRGEPLSGVLRQQTSIVKPFSVCEKNNVRRLQRHSSSVSPIGINSGMIWSLKMKSSPSPRPSSLGPNSPSSSSPLPFDQELGISRAFNNEFFDPLNFASDDNFPRLREAELKHGRIAMLATVGMFLPDVFRTPLMKGVVITLPSSNPPGAKPNQIEFGLQNVEFSPIAKLNFGNIPNGLGAIGKVPLGVWLQVFLAIGTLELFFWKQRSPKSLPGDYGTGFFGIHDYGQHEGLLENELELGRLAMVGFFLQILWELLMHTTVGEPYRNILYP
jgi:hypothetical protein